MLATIFIFCYGLFNNDISSSHCIKLNDRIIFFKAISWDLLGGTEENHKPVSDQ